MVTSTSPAAVPGGGVDQVVGAARAADVTGLDAWRSAGGATPLALLHTALRTDAPSLVEALARTATAGAMSMGELAAHVDRGGNHEQVLAPTVAAVPGGQVRPDQPDAVLERVACVAAHWCGTAEDARTAARGLRLFEALLETHGARALPPKVRAIPLQQALLSGRPELARRWIDLPGARPPIVQGVRADLARLGAVPAGAGEPDPDSPAGRAWLEQLNRPFARSGCTPLTVAGRGGTLFDRLRAEVPHRIAEGPLVTVLMPCWRPDAEGLLTSVRSITEQTWQPLEVLLLDDASGPGYEEVFERAAALDERIRVVRMPRNGGSYVARNHGIAVSRGEYVTVQDADDWSHPERIERHVRDLEARPKVPANRSQALRVKDDLTQQWLGYPPDRRNASSLMVRRSVLEEVGGFQAVRKGADSEFHARLDALGRPVRDIDDYLAVIRLSSGSLSRGDFVWNRNNPDRLAYRGVYAAWHRSLKRAGGGRGPRARALAARSGIDDERTQPFAVPRAWSRELPTAEGGTRPASEAELRHAWVVRGDFSQPARALQLRELLEAGVRPVLWHQERPLPVTELRPELADDVADLVVAEQLEYVSANERTLAENLLVLDHGLAERPVGAVRAERVWLDADRLADETGIDSLVDLGPVPGRLQAAFGVAPQWFTREDPAACPLEGAVRAPWRD